MAQQISYKVTYKFNNKVTGAETITVPLSGGIEAVMDKLDGRNSEPATRTFYNGFDAGDMITDDGHMAVIEAIN